MSSSSLADKDIFTSPSSSTRSKKKDSKSQETESSTPKKDSSFESKSDMSEEEEDSLSFDLQSKCLKFASELEKFDGLDVSLLLITI